MGSPSTPRGCGLPRHQRVAGAALTSRRSHGRCLVLLFVIVYAWMPLVSFTLLPPLPRAANVLENAADPGQVSGPTAIPAAFGRDCPRHASPGRTSIRRVGATLGDVLANGLERARAGRQQAVDQCRRGTGMVHPPHAGSRVEGLRAMACSYPAKGIVARAQRALRCAAANPQAAWLPPDVPRRARVGRQATRPPGRPRCLGPRATPA